MLTTEELLRELQELDATRAPDLIDEAVDAWEGLTRGLWAYRADHVQTITPEGALPSSVWLRLTPVLSIGRVEVLASPSSSTWTALDTDQYRLDGERELVRVGACWGAEVRVTYTGGYGPACVPEGQEAPRAPAAIRRALLTQIKFLFARTNDTQLTTRVKAGPQGGGASTFLRPDYHPSFVAAARRHRRHA